MELVISVVVAQFLNSFISTLISNASYLNTFIQIVLVDIFQQVFEWFANHFKFEKIKSKLLWFICSVDVMINRWSTCADWSFLSPGMLLVSALGSRNVSVSVFFSLKSL